VSEIANADLLCGIPLPRAEWDAVYYGLLLPLTVTGIGILYPGEVRQYETDI